MAAAEPVAPAANFAVAPVIPADWKVANILPAGTAPANEAIHVAAHDPAVIPEDVKPRTGSMAAVPNNAVAPTEARHET